MAAAPSKDIGAKVLRFFLDEESEKCRVGTRGLLQRACCGCACVSVCFFCGVGAVFNTRVCVWKRRRGLCIIHDATRGGTQSDIMSQG